MDGLALAAASKSALSAPSHSRHVSEHELGAGMHLHLKRYGCVPPAVCAGSRNCSAVAPGEVSHLQQSALCYTSCSASRVVCLMHDDVQRMSHSLDADLQCCILRERL